VSAAAEGAVEPARPQGEGAGLVWVALGFALLALLVLLFVPTVEDQVGTVVDGEFRAVDTRRITLTESEGWWIVLPLLLPVAATALPLLARGRPAELPLRVAVAVALTAFVAIAALSIGPFYIPSALAMAAAAFLGRSTGRSTAR
jgi:hypothetical protein